MQAQEIEAHLAELGQELQNLHVPQPIRILLVGGAFMLTQLHNRSTTNDVSNSLMNQQPRLSIASSKHDYDRSQVTMRFQMLG